MLQSFSWTTWLQGVAQSSSVHCQICVLWLLQMAQQKWASLCTVKQFHKADVPLLRLTAKEKKCPWKLGLVHRGLCYLEANQAYSSYPSVFSPCVCCCVRAHQHTTAWVSCPRAIPSATAQARMDSGYLLLVWSLCGQKGFSTPPVFCWKAPREGLRWCMVRCITGALPGKSSWESHVSLNRVGCPTAFLLHFLHSKSFKEIS